MTEAEFDDRVRIILGELDQLPTRQRIHIRALLDETRRRDQEIRTAVRRAYEAVDDLRLVQKYFAFDQEARMRERELGA